MSRRTSQLILSLIDRVTGPARRAAQSVRGITQAITEGNGQRLRAMSDANRQNIGRLRTDLVDAAGTALALGVALGAPIRAAMSFESAMADVRKVVEFDKPEQFEEMARDLRAMSRQVPISAEGLASMAAAAGQAGIARDQILEFVRSAAMVGTAFDISADAAGDALAHLRTGLSLTTPQAVSLADAINELSNKQASAAPDILEVVTRVGAQAKQFGLAGEQVAAYASAMLSTGQAPEVVATSIRNMGKALTRGEAATKRQSEAFGILGLDATDVARRMQTDAVGTIEEVIARLGRLPAYMQAAVSTDLFGDEARALGPLLTNQRLMAESLGIVGDRAKYAGSAQREYDVRSRTSANRAILFANVMRNLSITIGTILIPAMQAITDVLAPVADAIERLTSAHPGLTRAIVVTIGALVAFRLATIAFRFGKAQMLQALIDLGLGLGVFQGKLSKGRGALVAFGGRFAFVRTGAAGLATALQGKLAGAYIAATLQAKIFSRALKAGKASVFANHLLQAINPLRLFRRGLGLSRAALVGVSGGFRQATVRAGIFLATVKRGGLAGMRTAVIDLALGLRRQLVGAYMAATLQATVFSRSMKAGGVRGMATGLLTMLNPLRMIRGALALTKLAFRGLLIGSGIGILVLAAGWIIENWSKVKAFFTGFASGFMAAIAPVRPALQPLIDGIATVVGWVRRLLGDSGGSEGSWKNWGESAGKAIGGVVVWIARLIGGIATVIQKAGEMWSRLRNGGQAPNLPTPRTGGAAPAPGGGRPAMPSAGRQLAGARAGGGYVRQGDEYLVGEEGPEIFKAGRSGTIYPNGELQRVAGDGASRPVGGSAPQSSQGGRGERRFVFAPQIGPFHVTGADAQSVFRDVMAQLRAEFRQFMGGIHADNGEFA
ncbi:phage tail tape measure protein [Brevundimonas sp.]|uniref:phage tail tape measure protein n=1 Tax=Brevundimonas sp. TaxID=1871086 RepID=UPI00286D4F7B|nr:phage tail tape measure protein [Brevundimonas sp.]